MAVDEQIKTNTEEQEQQGQQKVKKKTENSTAIILILVVFLVILLSIPIIFTRFNILGAGESLRPMLKTNSIFRYILPPAKDPNDISTMSREELININNELKSKIKVLETQLKESQRVSEIYTGIPDGFEKLDYDKAQIKSQQELIQKEKEAIEKDKAEFFKKVKNENKPAFVDYYEKMDPETAKKLYAEILKEDKVYADIKAFVDYYEKMDPTSAAKIFEQISKSDINLAANIIKYMEKGKGSKILQAMDPKISSRITDILAKQTSILN